MSETVVKSSEAIKELNVKIEKILAEYRIKHDELELAVEEWDIGEIQEALANYSKEIKLLKKKVHDLKEAS
jgi:uncharacterized coiled-coil protein SlyX